MGPSLAPHTHPSFLSFLTEGAAGHSCPAQDTIKAGEGAVNTSLASWEALLVRIPWVRR